MIKGVGVVTGLEAAGFDGGLVGAESSGFGGGVMAGLPGNNGFSGGDPMPGAFSCPPCW